MKKRPNPKVKGQPSKSLPEPLSGLGVDDLLWDYASPLSSLIFDDLEREPPAEDFWATVSGAAVFWASTRSARSAKALYEGTTAPVLRRVRKHVWLYRQELATRDAMLLWSALLTQQAERYPEATDGQLWVLIRDAIRQLVEELRLVENDGR
jgi:hypothetical protein